MNENGDIRWTVVPMKMNGKKRTNQLKSCLFVTQLPFAPKK